MKKIFSNSLAIRGGFGKVVALFLLVLLAGCGGSPNSTPAKPTSPSLAFTTIPVNVPSQALNSPVVGPLPDDTLLHVRLMFHVNQSQQNGLNKVSTGGGQDLQKFANQIGISDATYQKIKAVLGVQGVSLTLSKLHTELKVDATARVIAALFQTHFVLHKYQGRTFYVPATPPRLPSFIANELLTVTGLDSYSAPLQKGITTTALHAQHPQADCSPPSNQLFPADLAQSYGYNQFYSHGYHGENMTINLVEIDGVTANDVLNYQQCVGYQGHISVKDVDGAPTQAEGESVLDIEMIEGLARNANIADYETANPAQGIPDILQQILDDNTNNTGSGSVVSISLGAAENLQTLNEIKATDQLLYLLTQKEHMTVFVASGDCAAFTDGVFNSLSVSFPASDPNVVGVGGTVLQVNSQGGRVGESVWSDSSDTSKCNNAWGSGGGSSNFFQQPNWQSGPGVTNDASRGFRQVPDVSAVATNLAFYFGGQWATFPDGEGAGGGTSAATPIWATGMALVNQALIHQYRLFFNGPPVFYYVAGHAGKLSPYYDVTQGNNVAFNATPGWDFASGLGTPNLVDFYSILASAASQQ